MGETRTLHFYDSRIFEPATKPQNQLSLSLETPGHLKQIKNNPQTFCKTTMSLGILKLQNFDIFRKDGHRK